MFQEYLGILEYCIRAMAREGCLQFPHAAELRHLVEHVLASQELIGPRALLQAELQSPTLRQVVVNALTA